MIHWKYGVFYEEGYYYDEDELGGFENIDQSRLTRALIYNKDHPPQHYVLVLKEGMRFIFFRRSKQVIDLGNEKQWNEYVCTCFGWQKTVNGKNVKHLIWLGPDGSAVVSDRDIDEI